MSEAKSVERFDIFISYTHEDNAGQSNWVSEFKDDLFRRIKQKEGRPLSIYIDERQSGLGGTLPDQIREVLENSKYLLPVVSPLYAKSPWCDSERVVFIETHGAEEALKRLIRVDKEPVEDVAGELEDLKQYRFYYRDEGREIDFVVSKDTQPGRYFELITELALHILHDINAVNKTRDNTVYVARTSQHLTSKRDEIVKALEQRGFNVVPTSLGVLAGKAREKAERILKSAFMSVHLIDDEFEPILKGSAESVDRIQFDEAVTIGAEGLDVYVWSPPGEFSDPRQAALLETVRATNAKKDLLHDFHAFREEVINAAETHREINHRPQEMQEEAINVYLHYGVEDQGCEDVTALIGALVEAGAEVFEPDYARESPHEHAAACNAILYYFGDSPYGNTLYTIKTRTDFDGPCLARGIFLKAGLTLRNPTNKAVLMSADGTGSATAALQPFLEPLGLA